MHATLNRRRWRTCISKQSEHLPVYSPWRRKFCRKVWTAGSGMMYPTLFAFISPEKATPTSLPDESKTGPPELPGLMAASICTHKLSVRPPTKMRETTPRVADTCKFKVKGAMRDRGSLESSQ